MNNSDSPRPKNGALWWSELYTDYFDLEFNDMFSGELCTARGFYNIIKAYITKQHNSEQNTYKFRISVGRLLNDCDDVNMTATKILEYSEKLLRYGWLSDFRVVKEDKENHLKTILEFGRIDMLKYFDTYTKTVTRQQNWLEGFSEFLERGLNIKPELNDSTHDECMEYAKIVKYGKKNQRESLLRNKDWDNHISVFEDSLKTRKTKVNQSIVKENKVALLDSNKGSNNTRPSLAPQRKRGAMFDDVINQEDNSSTLTREYKNKDELSF